MNNRIYAVRDTETGKLVSDITNPGHKFWEIKGSVQKVVADYNRRAVKRKHGKLELVCFELVEVKNEAD